MWMGSEWERPCQGCLGGSFAAAGTSVDLLLSRSMLLVSLWVRYIIFQQISPLASKSDLPRSFSTPGEVHFLGNWVWLAGSLRLMEWGKQWPLLIPSGCLKNHGDFPPALSPSAQVHQMEFVGAERKPTAAWAELPDCPWLQGRNKCCKLLMFSLHSVITVKPDWYNHYFIH